MGNYVSRVCKVIADSVDERVRTVTIIIYYSKAFNLVPHDRLFTKIAKNGVDLRLVVWLRVFPLGSSQHVRVDGQPSEEE